MSITPPKDLQVYIGKKFRHFKGGIYTIKKVILLADSDAWCFVYSNSKGEEFIRTVDNFLSKAPVSGKVTDKVPRFSVLEEGHPDRELEIIVRGGLGQGKTTMMVLLEKFLADVGMDPEINNDNADNTKIIQEYRKTLDIYSKFGPTKVHIREEYPDAPSNISNNSGYSLVVESRDVESFNPSFVLMLREFGSLGGNAEYTSIGDIERETAELLMRIGIATEKK